MPGVDKGKHNMGRSCLGVGEGRIGGSSQKVNEAYGGEVVQESTSQQHEEVVSHVKSALKEGSCGASHDVHKGSRAVSSSYTERAGVAFLDVIFFGENFCVGCKRG